MKGKDHESNRALQTQIAEALYHVEGHSRKRFDELSPFMQNKYLKKSSALLSFTERGEPPERKKAQRQTLPKVLTTEEIRKLYGVADEIEKLILDLYLRTGLRVSEGVRLRVRDIDLTSRVIFVSKGKRKKDRRIPLEAGLRDILQEYIRKYQLGSDDHLLCVKKWAGCAMKNQRYYKKTDGPYTDYQVYKVVRKLADKAGLQEVEPGTGSTIHKMRSFRVHPHLLRHTALTRIQEACGDITVTKEIAGHSSLTMTQLYVHLSQGRKRDGLDLAYQELPAGIHAPAAGEVRLDAGLLASSAQGGTALLPYPPGYFSQNQAG